MESNNARGSGTQTVNQFIVKLEASAKKILKDASKKQKEAARKAHNEMMMGKGKKESESDTLKKMGSVLMSSTNTKDNSNAKTVVMNYSVPRMEVTMASREITTMNLHGHGNNDRDENISPRGSALSPIKKRSNSADVIKGEKNLMSQSQTFKPCHPSLMPPQKPRASKVLERLGQSALVSAGTGSLNDILLSQNKKNKATGLGNNTDISGGEEAPAPALGLHIAKDLAKHASNILGGTVAQDRINKLHKKIEKTRAMKNKPGYKATDEERQGPIDWSSNGLKIKYRGESEREYAYQAWYQANAHSFKMLEESDMVLPMSKIERHPLCVHFDENVQIENYKSSQRTKARLQMKRFVLDVQEIWLTNLQHLREHQPARILEARVIKKDDECVDEHGDEEVLAIENDQGLSNRRDTKAITAMESQIQSVSMKRALGKAFYTTRMPEPKVVLDYEERKTPNLNPPPPLPPFIDILSNPQLVDITIDEKIIAKQLAEQAEREREGIEIEKDPEENSQTPLNCLDMECTQVLLYVDRLLPSVDSIMANQGVFWRFSVYRREDSCVREYMCRESSVATYVTNIMAAGDDNKDNNVTKSVYSSDEDIKLEWGAYDVSAKLEISVITRPKNNKSNSSNENANYISIEVRAQLAEEYGSTNEDLFFCSSPIELMNLLGIPNEDPEDLAWWCSPNRSDDIWLDLISKLYIEASVASSEDSPIPTTLLVRYDKTDADRVDGGLTRAQSMFCLHELLSRLKIDQMLNIVVDEAPRSFFFDPRIQLPIGTVVEMAEQSTEYEEDNYEERTLNYVLDNNWEEISDLGPNLSMKSSGYLQYVSQCPGANEHGRKGLWFPHRMPKEYTQVGANYFRDPKNSTTDTVFVNFVLALDTSIIFPSVLAWEDFPQFPPKAPAEEVNGVVPTIAPKPYGLAREVLINELETRLSYPSMIFGSLPIEGIDHIPLDLANKPVGMCRHWPARNEFGFRRKIVVTLLGCDPVLPTIVFGISKEGARPNIVGVNTRNIWHSTLAITENINRPRAPKDYHYIVQNNASCGANDPASFAAKLKGQEFVGLSSSVFKEFEKEYAEIMERRAIFAKQLALDAKIEASQMKIKIKEIETKERMKREIQGKLEKKLRKATKSEKGWARRFHMSTIVEIQGQWERRKDNRAGSIFFRKHWDVMKGKEKYLESCQWEIPATWDGDPLAGDNESTYDDNPDQDFKDDIGSEYDSLNSVRKVVKQTSLQLGDFEQPGDSWVPENDTIVTGLTTTPGVHMQISNSKKKEIEAMKILQGGGVSEGGKRKKSQSRDLDSKYGEESLVESSVATIDTANLEHIAEQLISSDELMIALAKRLGISVDKVVPAEDLTSVFSISVAEPSVQVNDNKKKGTDDAPLLAPRDDWMDDLYEPEIDSDDDLWSDDDIEVGDFDADDIGETPEGLEDVAYLKRKAFRDTQDVINVPGNVPFLNLMDQGLSSKEDESGKGAGGWRKLARPELHPKFFHQCGQTRTLGPYKEYSNTSNVPIYLTPISPVDACQYEPENFAIPVDVMFVSDAKKDMARALATLERNIKREELLSKNLLTDDLLLFGEANEMTGADLFVAKQYKDDQQEQRDPREVAIDLALLAAKSSNIAQMEDALEEDIPINTSDQFGNSLLLLAAQQGSMRMVKFLLRRGANMNFQNLTGNTAMHYCHAYSAHALGHYLKSKVSIFIFIYLFHYFYIIYNSFIFNS